MYLPVRAECATGGNRDALGGGEFLFSELHLGEVDLAGVKGHAAQRGVSDGARLLPDLLEHEVFVSALFRLDRVPRDAGKATLDGIAIKVSKLHAGEGEDGHVAIGKEVDVAGVVKDAGHVGSDEAFAIADADDHGRPGAGGDDFVRLCGREHSQGKRAGEALDSAADGHLERDGLAGQVGVDLHLLDEVGNDFRVGFSDELVAQLGKFALELEVVFDDAVMDDDKAARAVAMGVGVLFSGAAMRCPAGVTDAKGALEGVLAENFFKVCELARCAPQLQRGAGRAANCNASRVVAAIFEAPQPFNNDWNNLLRTYITNNAAHGTILSEEEGDDTADLRLRQ
jgi:hypothetical protein